jgi:hypothetical protein
VVNRQKNRIKRNSPQHIHDGQFCAVRIPRYVRDLLAFMESTDARDRICVAEQPFAVFGIAR